MPWVRLPGRGPRAPPRRVRGHRPRSTSCGPAVRLYRESDPKPVIRKLAEQLGVHHEALRNWIRQDEADRGERAGQPTSEMAEENKQVGSTRQDRRATPAPDLVNRDFTAVEPNRLWVANATRIVTGQGVFWLAAVRDAFSNRIVGWKCSDRCDTELLLGALEYAVWSRQVREGQLIHHSDRGSTYTAFRFSNRLADNGITRSMGTVGDRYDNALMENFFSTLKTELVYRTSWRTREEAENTLFAYIDGWYNTQRIQKQLGWRSPAEYEASYHQPVPARTR
ncbi:IS3 family transposase [Amycolatopsis carbonis]|uniref:IS3 family transposase n=1 Tax=Amycolatopsis carbonis TaxID=715471 RepID=A0A9Y2IQ09_9PSEU|nr:IS3 family transposase [Amycolatopsis sp. 2-15]WIX83311.1 IS3 family transposase [Amycolatopsis sp. 2-15]